MQSRFEEKANFGDGFERLTLVATTRLRLYYLNRHDHRGFLMSCGAQPTTRGACRRLPNPADPELGMPCRAMVGNCGVRCNLASSSAGPGNGARGLKFFDLSSASPPLPLH